MGNYNEVGFLGAGSMGAMLVRAFVNAGALEARQIWVSNRTPQKLQQLAAEVPGIHTADNAAIAARCRLLFLCMKHTDLGEALKAMPLTPGHLLVTLSSPVPFEWFEQRAPSRVAKFIPAVTQEIGRGPSLLIWGPRITADDASTLRELASAISLPVIIPEQHRRLAADLASAAPAFLAYLLFSMAEAAVRYDQSFAPEVGHTLVREMAIATCALMAEKNMSYDEVIRRVATPGGMTAKGLEVLAEHLPAVWKELFAALEQREKDLAAKVG
ncbi:MAG TPA: pyrroline-5-carboxylate reductase dimerization domain-containing protein [Terriglobales bacterium]|nr:pyrroline-5-carboxylate reductase dimerization domain-containing protein [Terriglobales bacterium]